MAEFSVKTNAARTTADAEERLRKELGDIQQTIRQISRSLVLKTAASTGIKMRLNGLAGRVGGHQNSMGNMKNALERVAGLYEETERGISGYADENVKSAEIKKSESGSSFWDNIMGFMKGIIDTVGTAVGGIFSHITTIWGNMWQNSVDWIKNMGEILGNGIVVDMPPHVGWLPAFSGVLGNIWHPTPPGPTTGTESGNTPPSETAGGSVTGSAAGGAQSIGDLEGRVGTIIADINGENYCSNKNISYAGGYHGQCTWYAYGRFMEVTGIKLNSAKHAKTWLYNNANDRRVNVIRGVENIQSPAIAVQETGGYGYGHVMFIEDVEYNADGTPAYVYMTEANNSYVKPDGILQKLTYEDFKNKGISGYITAS